MSGIVISESDLRIRCDAGCRQKAWYACTIKSDPLYVRFYCPRCTAALLQGVAKALSEGESIHDWVETEHLLKGRAIATL